MARYAFLKNSFNLGEFDTKAYGISNLQEYTRGAAELLNMIPRSLGGARRRPGSKYLASTADFITASHTNIGTEDSAEDISLIGAYTRIVPFTFIDEDQEVVHSSIIFRLGSNDDLEFTITPGGTPFTSVGALTTTSFLSGSGDSNYEDNDPAPIDLAQLKYIQVGNYVYFVGEKFIPFYIGYSTIGSPEFKVGNIFTLPNINFTTPISQRVPFRLNTTSTTLASSATAIGTGVTITASSSIFVDSMKNTTMFRMAGGCFVITDVASDTSATAAIVATLTSGSATTTWEESMWSNRFGWPRTITYFQGRLYCMGSRSFQDGIWATQSGDVAEWAPASGATITDDDAFNFSLSQGEAERIFWCNGKGRELVFGTEMGEYIVYGPDSNLSVSARNVDIKKETTHGSYKGAASVRVDNALYFFDKQGCLREFVFDERENAFRTRDVTIFNRDVLQKTIQYRQQGTGDLILDYTAQTLAEIYDIQVQIDRSDNILWCVDNYEGLSSIVINRATETFAPSYHVMGGSLTNHDIPKVSSIALVDNELFLMVYRTIDGSTEGYLEAIGVAPRAIDIDTMTYGAGHFYLDSYIYDDEEDPTTLLDNLDHLEGEVVGVFRDGKYYNNTAEVTSGELTIPESVIAIAGLRYTSRIKTLPIDAGAVTGTAVGSVRRFEEAAIRFEKTVAANVYTSSTETEDINFRPASLDLGDPTPLFTGLKKIQVGYTDEEQQLTIETDKPLPMEVTSITFKGTTYE